jgi:hypothetical protein
VFRCCQIDIPGLVGWLAAGNQDDVLVTRLLRRRAGGDEVTVVDGIETPAATKGFHAVLTIAD